ncbi:MAG: hypothetical protein GXO93_08215 [FCB group bacterium]|nr:hypothetical protein [FCB group bacterium]
MVVFPNLLRGIDQISKEFKLPVRKITHDRQNQFQSMLKEWHDLLSNAAPDIISWMGEEKFSLRCVENSTFIISSSVKSVGIQTIDTVLWLYKRYLEGKPIGNNSQNLLQYVFDNAYQYGLSFKIVGNWLSEYMEELYSKPFSEEDINRAKTMIQKAEEKRQQNMADYSKMKFENIKRDYLY